MYKEHFTYREHIILLLEKLAFVCSGNSKPFIRGLSCIISVTMSDKKVYKGKKGTKTSYPTRRRSSASKRPMNRFEAEGDSAGVSASARKLQMNNDDIDVKSEFGYRIINFFAVFSVISQHVKCKTCDSNIIFHETSARGLGFKIVISCPKCPRVEIPNSKFIRNGYEINRRIVLVMRLLGVGLNGIIKFCAFMEMPRPIFQSFYDKIVDMISIATATVRDISMKKAAEEEKKMSEENGQLAGITVSGDGSWRKRGYSSLFGITSLIGWFTGKIVDVEVKSKYCKSCEHWKSKLETVEYEEWLKTHVDECQANHEGSSGKMEVDAVVEMFQRSETLHGMKYANYVGDGDSKTFKGILEKHPYENFEVKKKECIDHVQKRMGTRLRNVKGLGGKGKLTAKLIDELTIYYGLAIRRNPNSVKNMKNDIWATLFHKMSTDENPQHEKCSESWCDWKKAQAANSLATYHHKPPLPKEIFEAIKPIYEELSRDDLLNRCLGGYTQNSNESFNAAVWNLAPKSYSSGKKVLCAATDIAVCTFNDGLTNILRIMQVLEMDIGYQAYNFCLEANATRIEHSERALTDAAKKARTSTKSSRKENEEQYLSKEGMLYGPGIAD
ncbi:uncharacterized protein LOC120358202 [Solenopsis invicta]|uniref:uncharacterized protein LOC120358202 n=1 Tax=Solenopsis invicta TaxID=13686 RepID=UPI00193E79CA|nr:uncharacterized protein LOC120358202 [Solenopsis invicta]